IHYVSLFLPPLFIGLIYGLKKLVDVEPSKKIVSSLKKNLTLVILILIGATLYSSVTLGPLPAVAKAIFKSAGQSEIKQIKSELLKALPPRQSLAATYDFLTHLSSREKIYGLNYAFVGKKQFTDLDYELPNDLEGIVMDSADLITFALQFPSDNIWQKNVLLGDDRLRKIIALGLKAVKIIDSYVVFERSGEAGMVLYETQAKIKEIQNPQKIKLGDVIDFLGWSKILGQRPTSPWLENSKFLPISLYFQAQKKLDKNFQLKLSFKDSEGKILGQKYYALAYGLYPTTEWPVGDIIKINDWFLIPKNLASTNYQIELQLVDLKGFITLNGLRSVVPQITEETPLGPIINIK
ncbi:MAG: DUF2079 domain-containing protein, partial [Candidatus Kerfeldbacteria bacterium]|nr:DUF2079 domain-containing protein [Candidatus Kerfeldbacteria bacterium]